MRLSGSENMTPAASGCSVRRISARPAPTGIRAFTVSPLPTNGTTLRLSARMRLVVSFNGHGSAAATGRASPASAGTSKTLPAAPAPTLLGA